MTTVKPESFSQGSPAQNKPVLTSAEGETVVSPHKYPKRKPLILTPLRKVTHIPFRRSLKPEFEVTRDKIPLIDLTGDSQEEIPQHPWATKAKRFISKRRYQRMASPFFPEIATMQISHYDKKAKSPSLPSTPEDSPQKLIIDLSGNDSEGDTYEPAPWKPNARRFISTTRIQQPAGQSSPPQIHTIAVKSAQTSTSKPLFTSTKTNKETFQTRFPKALLSTYDSTVDYSDRHLKLCLDTFEVVCPYTQNGKCRLSVKSKCIAVKRVYSPPKTVKRMQNDPVENYTAFRVKFMLAQSQMYDPYIDYSDNHLVWKDEIPSCPGGYNHLCAVINNTGKCKRGSWPLLQS